MKNLESFALLADLLRAPSRALVSAHVMGTIRVRIRSCDFRNSRFFAHTRPRRLAQNDHAEAAYWVARTADVSVVGG